MSAVCEGRLLTLHPGDVAVGQRGDTLQTLLGSCVAVVLTDPRRTVGAMCHIVHRGVAAPGRLHDAAYAAVALGRMRELLLVRGIQAAQCEAYVAGGGYMFPAVPSMPDVGAANVDWVLGELSRLGVRLLWHDTGGTAYRRLQWTVGPLPPVVSVHAL